MIHTMSQFVLLIIWATVAYLNYPQQIKANIPVLPAGGIILKYNKAMNFFLALLYHFLEFHSQGV